MLVIRRKMWYTVSCVKTTCCRFWQYLRTGDWRKGEVHAGKAGQAGAVSGSFLSRLERKKGSTSKSGHGREARGAAQGGEGTRGPAVREAALFVHPGCEGPLFCVALNTINRQGKPGKEDV